MPHLSVPGAELAYESDGRASAPALLLIPAGIATLRMWDPQVEALAADHLVVRYDPRGFGATRHDPAVPFSNHADALAVLDHLGVDRATLVGASRGGRLALDVALHAPDRISGVVVIGAEPSGSPELPRSDEEARRFDELDRLDPALDARRLVRLETTLWAAGPLRLEGDLDPAFVRRAHELNEPNIAHATDDGTVVPLEPPAFGRLGDIRSPVLVMVGEHDVSATRSALRAPARGAARRDGILLPGRGAPAECRAPRRVPPRAARLARRARPLTGGFAAGVQLPGLSSRDDHRTPDRDRSGRPRGADAPRRRRPADAPPRGAGSRSAAPGEPLHRAVDAEAVAHDPVEQPGRQESAERP